MNNEKTEKVFTTTADDMHPYNCNTPYGGSCIHCERKQTENHDPSICALCDPEYDYKENKFWKEHE